MDFAHSEEHATVAELADRVLGEHGAPDRLTAIEADDGFDRDLWKALADTGLLGVSLPEPAGGGLGFLAVHLLAEAAGRHLAHVPLWETLTAAAALARFAGARDVLGRIAAGQAVLTVALQDLGTTPYAPTTVVRVDGDAARITGTKVLVPWADQSDHLLVSAVDEATGTPTLVLVDRTQVTVTPHALSSDVPHGSVELDDALGTRLDDPDGQAHGWLVDRAVAGLAAMQAGMLDAAVRLASDHTSRREQFGRPVGSFQAVAHRVASAFIDAECARLTALQASWRLHEELPAGNEVAVAKWWAAEAGHQVLHAVQHVHGGIGVDREYPLHRYYLRTKQVEFALGSAADHLGRLGAALAVDPA